MPMFEFVIPSERLYFGLCEGVKLDVHFPGYPTLKHIKHTVRCKHHIDLTKSFSS